MVRFFIKVLITALAASLATGSGASAQDGAVPENLSEALSVDLSNTIPITNFDFLEGVWQIDSRHQRSRMNDDQVWLQNDLETEYQILLGGLVALNQTYGAFNGRPMHGFMMRTYDPDIDQWTMQWMSRGYPHLTEQVRGRFRDGFGEFLGTEVNQGRTFAMRFRWYRLGDDHAYWEQSYQDPDSGEWEVNWMMELRRAASDNRD